MEEKIIRVAQVIGMAVDGGTESVWMNYYRHLDRTKIQFDFLVENESNIINKKEIESMGGRVVIIPPYTNPFKYMKELKKIFKENHYDIVHSNMNAMSVFTLRAAKKAGIKVRIAHSHSTSNKKEWKKNILKNLLRPFSKVYATHYLACSELAGRWLFGNKTFDKGLVKIVANAIDYDRFKFNESYREEIRNKYSLNDSYVVGHIGRFMTQKNHKFVVEVFKGILELNPKSKLLLIGDGPLKPEIQSLVNELNLADNVVFAETRLDVEKYYSAMDMFIFPSLYEGLGMTAVEAQINGLKCVVSTNLPKDVEISDNIRFMNLDEDLSNWSKSCINKDRTDKLMINRKYSIDENVNLIIEMYQSIAQNLVGGQSFK